MGKHFLFQEVNICDFKNRDSDPKGSCLSSYFLLMLSGWLSKAWGTSEAPLHGYVLVDGSRLRPDGRVYRQKQERGLQISVKKLLPHLEEL